MTRQSKAKQDAAESGVSDSREQPIDITQTHIPGAYGTSYRNIWRVDDTLIIYDHRRGGWQRVPIDSDEAKRWARFMSHPAAYRDFTARLREYLKTVTEVIETVDRAEVEAFLSQYVREQNSIRRAYIQITQESARILIRQRFGDADRVPKEEIVKIVEDQAELCANHYRQTLEFMERGL